MLLSLVIPSLNTKGHLEAMMASLVTHRPTVPYEVIVVDMSSKDGTVEMLKSSYPDVKILEDVPNKGYGAACNAGIAVAQGTHMFICNSDLIFREGSVDLVARTLQEVDDDALLGFRLEHANGVLQRSALYFPGRLDLIWIFSASVRSSWDLSFRLGRFMADWDITERTPVDWVTGAALAASRALWSKTGGFDEEFFMFSEEVDLCRRVHDLGGTVFYVPEVVITHAGSASMGNTDLKVQWLVQGKVRYIRKHHGSFILFVGRLGATVAYLTSFPVWIWRWLRRAITAGDFGAQVVRYGKALVKAWST